MILIQTATLVSALLHILGIDLYVAEARSIHHLHSPEHFLDNAYQPDPVLANPLPVLPVTNLSPWGPGLYGDIINQAQLTDLPYTPVANGISANAEAVLNGFDGELTIPLVSYNQLAVPIGEALTTPFLTHTHSLYPSHTVPSHPLLTDSLLYNHLSHPYTSPHSALPQSLLGDALTDPWNSVPSLTHGCHISSVFGHLPDGLFNPVYPAPGSLYNHIGTTLPYQSLATALPISV